MMRSTKKRFSQRVKSKSTHTYILRASKLRSKLLDWVQSRMVTVYSKLSKEKNPKGCSSIEEKKKALDLAISVLSNTKSSKKKMKKRKKKKTPFTKTMEKFISLLSPLMVCSLRVSLCLRCKSSTLSFRTRVQKNLKNIFKTPQYISYSSISSTLTHMYKIQSSHHKNISENTFKPSFFMSLFSSELHDLHGCNVIVDVPVVTETPKGAVVVPDEHCKSGDAHSWVESQAGSEETAPVR